MAKDIVPELYKKIQSEFEQNMKASRLIRSFQSREKHTAKEVSLYAEELGKCASSALLDYLAEENLPNGTLYWNIAYRIIVPFLNEIHGMVMEAAEKMQRQQDEQIGIRITPIRPEFPEERVNGLINKLMDYQEDENGK
ncbi:MAG: hypothetical protein IJ106_10450 [Parasporobacterium sp.]|nr:hypothetical protein [Parasporobacterium sp.]